MLGFSILRPYQRFLTKKGNCVFDSIKYNFFLGKGLRPLAIPAKAPHPPPTRARLALGLLTNCLPANQYGLTPLYV